jgi:hypothetical protein
MDAVLAASRLDRLGGRGWVWAFLYKDAPRTLRLKVSLHLSGPLLIVSRAVESGDEGGELRRHLKFGFG